MILAENKNGYQLLESIKVEEDAINERNENKPVNSKKTMK